MRLRHSLLFFLLALSATYHLSAQTPWSSGASTGADLTIKLVTLEPGDPLYTWWGHAALVVEDRRSGYSLLYDYGNFSFRQEHFYTNFAQGRLLFEVRDGPTQAYLEHYRNLNRTVRIQTLRMAPEMRLALALFLDTNAQPQNRVYLYDHYYDNCATRLRDLIDEYTDGALRRATMQGSGVTFREETRRFLDHSFVMDFLLNYLMSDVIDREMTEWETMFLPEHLEEHVAALTVSEPNGKPVPLVLNTVVFNRAVGRRPIPEVASPLWIPSLTVGLIVGGLMLIGALIRYRFDRTGAIIQGTVFAIAGFVAGLLGTLLFYMSLFTDHTVTYGNENLVYTNPLALVLIVAGILIARRKPISRRFGLYATASFVALTVLLVLGKLIFPSLNQENWPQIAMFGPIYLLAFLSALTGELIPVKRARRESQIDTDEGAKL